MQFCLESTFLRQLLPLLSNWNALMNFNAYHLKRPLNSAWTRYVKMRPELWEMFKAYTVIEDRDFLEACQGPMYSKMRFMSASQGKALRYSLLSEHVGKRSCPCTDAFLFFACRLVVAVLGHEPSWLVQTHCGLASLHG